MDEQITEHYYTIHLTKPTVHDALRRNRIDAAQYHFSQTALSLALRGIDPDEAVQQTIRLLDLDVTNPDHRLVINQEKTAKAIRRHLRALELSKQFNCDIDDVIVTDC